MLAPLKHELAVRIKLLNPVELAVFGNVVAALGILSDVGNEPELARPGAIFSTDRLSHQQLAIRCEDQHSIVMGIRDEQIAVSIESQSAGLALHGGWRFEPVLEFAVSVEDLDPSRHIDDEQAVRRVDGDGPGLEQFPVG